MPISGITLRVSLIFYSILLIAGFLVISGVNTAQARDVSFSWTANTDDPPIESYKLYYKIGGPGSTLEEYTGTTDASGGNPSPVVIPGQSTTTYTLQNLLDSEQYTFVLTAYRDAESPPTEPITLAANTAPAETRQVSFGWTANTDDPPVDGYKLYYKTGDAGATLADYVGFTDASGGNPSPVTILGQDTNQYALSNLWKNEKYTFVLTAFRGDVDSAPTEPITLEPTVTNSPPVANDASITTDEDSTYNGELTATDPDGDTLTYSIVSNGSKGSASMVNSAEGTFSYVPNPNANGSDSFAFKVSDGTVDSAAATVSVTITPVNDTPVATGGSITTSEDTTASGELQASDPDDDPLVYSIVADGSQGSAVVTNSSTGSFTYTPNTNATGSDAFTFRVFDGTAFSSAATIGVTITAVNDPPTANDAAITTNEDTAKTGQLGAGDPDGDSLTYSIVTNGSKGSAVITDISTGDFIYTPNTNATGSDAFTFKVSDGSKDSDPATVSVTITAVNDQPIAAAASFSTNEDTEANGQLTGSDPDQDSLTFSIVTNGSKGTAVVTDASAGTYIYTPNENETGTDSFTFRVNDGTVNSEAATVSINIDPVNDPPVAVSSSFSINEDTVLNDQLMANDPDEDSLTYSLVTDGDKGSAAITDASTGAFSYTPNANANGDDTFTFRVNDGTVNSAEAVATVSIIPVNDTPVAYGASIPVNENTPYNGELRATDLDGDSLTYSIVTNAEKGNVVINDAATGDYTYTSDAGASGSDSFSFKVNDGSVDSNIATIDITIFDAATVTEIFGDTSDTDHPGTLADTFTNVNTDINADLESLSTYSWTPTSPHGIANTIILKADLSTIPTYAKIIDAQLILHQIGSNGESQYINSVHQITGKDPIVEQVNGYNAFNGEPWSNVSPGTTYNDIPLGLADIGAKEGELVLDTQNGQRSWSVTGMVQEWVADPASNKGLLIQGEETAVETGRAFASSENPSADIRPKLIVSYTTRPPAPQLIMIEEIK